jgi:hypothetical protein
MSTRTNNAFYGQSDDPREIELILNLNLKTRQGKIPWVKQANAITANIPGGFQINFVVATTLTFLPQSLNWDLLTVRDKSGNELVRVNGGNMISVITGGTRSELIAAADDLFKAANGVTGEGLDRAINAIKNL